MDSKLQQEILTEELRKKLSVYFESRISGGSKKKSRNKASICAGVIGELDVEKNLNMSTKKPKESVIVTTIDNKPFTSSLQGYRAILNTKEKLDNNDSFIARHTIDDITYREVLTFKDNRYSIKSITNIKNLIKPMLTPGKDFFIVTKKVRDLINYKYTILSKSRDEVEEMFGDKLDQVKFTSSGWIALKDDTILEAGKPLLNLKSSKLN